MTTDRTPSQDGPVAAPPPAGVTELMTDDEHAVVTLLGRAWCLLRDRVIAHGALYDADLLEQTAPIHRVQRAVEAQAAARAFPDRYRLLGETLDGADAPEPATVPAQPVRDVTGGDSLHPGTPESATAVLGRALLDRNDEAWWHAGADRWRRGVGRLAVYRSREDLVFYGPVREVLLVSPEAGEVLDAAQRWRTADRAQRRAHTRKPFQDDLALDDLAAAVDAMVGDRPAEPAPAERDETAEEVLAAFERGEKGVTVRPATVRASGLTLTDQGTTGTTASVAADLTQPALEPGLQSEPANASETADASNPPEQDSETGWDRDVLVSSRIWWMERARDAAAARDKAHAELEHVRGRLADQAGVSGKYIQLEAAARAELAEVTAGREGAWRWGRVHVERAELAERERAEAVAEVARLEEELVGVRSDNDRLRGHSTTLNTIAWKIATVLGDVPEGAEAIQGNAVEQADRLIAELATARRDATVRQPSDKLASNEARRSGIVDTLEFVARLDDRSFTRLTTLAAEVLTGTRSIPSSSNPEVPDGQG
jgi:hypothetical protein